MRVVHAPGMPGTSSPPPRVSDPDMHHGTCGTHVPWCMPGSLTSGFLWSRWRGKRSRHSRRMRNPPFYVSGKRPMGCIMIHSLSQYFVLKWKLNEEIVHLKPVSPHIPTPLLYYPELCYLSMIPSFLIFMYCKFWRSFVFHRKIPPVKTFPHYHRKDHDHR